MLDDGGSEIVAVGCGPKLFEDHAWQQECSLKTVESVVGLGLKRYSGKANGPREESGGRVVDACVESSDRQSRS